MSVILRSRMFYDCDTEAERDVSWEATYLIYTRDTNKWWKTESGAFVEVLRSSVAANTSIGGGGVPVVNVDPSTPTNNQMWVLQKRIEIGSATGMLGITYGETVMLDDFALRLQTPFGIRQTKFS